MKNAKTVNYTQIDNQAATIVDEKDVVILNSSQAYDNYDWCREWYDEKPEEGYFVWVKKSCSETINTNVVVSSPSITQNAKNLVVIDEGVETKMQHNFVAKNNDLLANHTGTTKVVVKQGAKIEINHNLAWGNQDTVESSMDLILDKGADVVFSQRCQKVPKVFKLKHTNHLDDNANLDFVTTILADGGNIEMSDFTYLNGKKCKGLSTTRMIARKDTVIDSETQMIAASSGTGHIDCMGLLFGKECSIKAIPELINNDKEASLTHEASVGKISDEILNYLRSRGLTEEESIKLIIDGFLGDEEKITIEGVELAL